MSDLIDDPAPGENAPEFSVSEISGAVKRVIEGEFGNVRIRGEVGRISRPRSGHVYLDLKDDRAVLASVIWKGVASRLRIQPDEGMEVVATGRLTTFPGQSRYQLVVEDIAPAGVGALMAMLEKLKAKLAEEGLFAAERKRRPPYLPKVIGVVTSPSGAVIRDILHRLRDRFPRPVLLWPVAVQGEKCAPEVAAAIRGFNRLAPDGAIPRPDVLIVARGGGSVEDLWGFNEEIVVRAVVESQIPVISAVGHETDTTLIDFAADLRAPTPTAAAELATPVRSELLAALAGLDERRHRAVARAIGDRRRHLTDLARAAPRADRLLADRRQRLDIAGERLPLALRGLAAAKRAALAQGPAGRFSGWLLTALSGRLAERLADRGGRLAPSLRRALSQARDRLSATGARVQRRRLEEAALLARDRLTAISARMDRAATAQVRAERERLASVARLLVSLGHAGVLARGFALVRDGEGSLVRSAAAVSSGMTLELQFADGRREAVAAGGAPEPKPGKKQRRRDSGDDQGSLF